MNTAYTASNRPQQREYGLTDRGTPTDAAQFVDGESDRRPTVDQRDSCKIGEGARAFLQTNTTCVICTLISDGSPHASAVHFATDAECEVFYICISKQSQTAQSILLDSRAAIAIGVDPATPMALQMHGHVTISDGVRLEEAQREFYARFPSSSSHKDNPSTVFAHFSPTWVRYSNGEKQKQFFMRGFSPDILEKVRQ